MLERLFALVGVPLSLLNAITDWVDADDQVSEGGGAEDAYYLAGSVPGLAANAPVRRVAELLAVRGADPATLDRLRPFVAAVDAPATINVNTAPPEVLHGCDRRARCGHGRGAGRLSCAESVLEHRGLPRAAAARRPEDRRGRCSPCVATGSW